VHGNTLAIVNPVGRQETACFHDACHICFPQHAAVLTGYAPAAASSGKQMHLFFFAPQFFINYNTNSLAALAPADHVLGGHNWPESRPS
jgi:hypothetical protein